MTRDIVVSKERVKIKEASPKYVFNGSLNSTKMIFDEMRRQLELNLKQKLN